MVEMTKRPTMRDIKEQFRMERHRAFLTAALRIVTASGLDGLTMPGLAEELDCGIGTLYRHFPSKDVLIAELQREALDIVNTSCRLSQAHLDELLVARGVDDPELVALARVVGATRFWTDAAAVYPQEIDLSRRMVIDPTMRLGEDEATRVMPAALRLLDLVSALLDDAVDAGALDEGPNVQRAVVLIAGTTGVVMTTTLSRWDGSLFDGQELSGLMVRDLFVGWGADQARLAAVDEILAELAGRGHLVPPVRR